jgi:type II secretion system protein G
MFSWERKGGFTLIELLIVVAIIAILAAIAVPNLLEAQTRSKVSRAKSDERCLVLAVECYRLDNNRYPPHRDTAQDTTLLTTPIAYLTALPTDPFNTTKNISYYQVGPTYTWQDLVDIYYNKWPTWGGGDWLARQVRDGKKYVLNSPGPDLTDTMMINAADQYDPTNGTISVGDIWRVGP